MSGWKLEKSRPPPKTSLKHDWKRELGSEDAQRPQAGQVVQQFKSSQLNQPNPNPDHDRTGQPVVGGDRTGSPLLEPTQGSRQVDEKRPVLRRSKHVHFMKKLLNVIERGNPLSAVTQAASQVTSNQCLTRWTLTSEFLDCHILL